MVATASRKVDMVLLVGAVVATASRKADMALLVGAVVATASNKADMALLVGAVATASNKADTALLVGAVVDMVPPVGVVATARLVAAVDMARPEEAPVAHADLDRPEVQEAPVEDHAVLQDRPKSF